MPVFICKASKRIYLPVCFFFLSQFDPYPQGIPYELGLPLAVVPLSRTMEIIRNILLQQEHGLYRSHVGIHRLGYFMAWDIHKLLHLFGTDLNGREKHLLLQEAKEWHTPSDAIWDRPLDEDDIDYFKRIIGDLNRYKTLPSDIDIARNYQNQLPRDQWERIYREGKPPYF